MKLTVNGEDRDIQAETLKGLIEELELQPEGVAAEVNLAVVSKKDYATCMLKEGDTVELVRFVGGG
ncbi:MAG: sulfur carrier protein ThiS [Phycisphaerae bacterium]|nr:sulfur carrier protein ThiS [Phycisphaerae bacterium]NIP54130.1 sulfur carrier protein ThiS [Phycisphaerae bacterium]NIX00501.1 sulfur carrier protein ThiS [Phycisphaerae bacterium]NIX29444.1 sulfur carrier protein ThiS [Phycisphaerae bacterium]